MANNSPCKQADFEAQPSKAEFLSLFRSIALERHRHDVFKDFVTTSAIAIHNAVAMNETLEQEYLDIINTYDSSDIQRMCELLGILIMLLDSEPTDILGMLYMELGLASAQNGQYFTPPSVSELMAQITHGESLANITKPFITLHEPACGSGGMVLAFAKIMLSNQHNPADKLWVSCIDVNRLASMMAYLQLSLWHIPGEILVGNTLSWDIQERWYTPAHYLNNWDAKLRNLDIIEKTKSLIDEQPKQEQEPSKKCFSEDVPQKLFSGSQANFDFQM